MQIFRNVILFIIVSIVFTGCETKEYNLPERPSSVETSASNINSSLTFSGLTTYSNVSDYGVILYWEDVSDLGAVSYKVYDVTNGGMTLVASIDAPASQISLDGLDNDTTYTFNVAAQDSEGRYVYNDATVEITTLDEPTAPSLVFRTNPYYNISKDAVARPTYSVYGVRKGDTVKLYTDSLCQTTAVASGVADNTSIQLTLTSDLNLGGPYYFYAKRINPKGVGSPCSSSSIYGYTYQTCPQGYIEVPASVDIGTLKFCVMEYEAKPWDDSYGNNYNGVLSSLYETDLDGCKESGCTTKNWGTDQYKPGSGPYGKPWRMLDATTAKAECKSLGDKYDLISNQEWMAIARNIEETTSNWPSGTIGVGCVKRGNIGISDSCSYGPGSIETDGGASTKAKHELSNGEFIYHFAGNVYEWVDMGKDDLLTLGPDTCESSWSDIEVAANFCSGQLSPDDFQTDNAGNLTLTTYGYVYDITQSANGNIYILTDGGLAKTTNNGATFTTYSALNGLPLNKLTGGVATNSSNHIYVGTTVGLAVSTDGGENFTLKTTTTNPNLASNNINDVYVDANDNLYVATTGGYSYLANGATTFTKFTTSEGLAHNNVLSIFVDGSTVLVGTASGLNITVDGGANFTVMTVGSHTLAGNRIEGIYANGGKLYLATHLGLSLATDFVAAANTATFTNKTTANGLGSNYIWDVTVNSDGDIFIATEVGLAFSTDGGTSIYNRTTSQGLAEDSVNAVFVDSSDNIWAATDAGVSYSTDDASSFTSKTEADGVGGIVSVGLGKISGGFGGTAYRGGAYNGGNFSGIYTLNLSSHPHQAFENFGFRCVYRP